MYWPFVISFFHFVSLRFICIFPHTKAIFIFIAIIFPTYQVTGSKTIFAFWQLQKKKTKENKTKPPTTEYPCKKILYGHIFSFHIIINKLLNHCSYFQLFILVPLIKARNSTSCYVSSIPNMRVVQFDLFHETKMMAFSLRVGR